MPKFKDWQPGECRVKVQVITAMGSTMDFYIPHLSEKDGERVAKLAVELLKKTPAKSKKPR